MAGLLLLGLMFALILIGVPIAMAICLSSVFFIIITGAVPMNFLMQAFTAGVSNFTTLGVPFFILAGELMIGGGIAGRLVNFCLSLMKNVKGALGMVTVLACMFFAAISGSGPATVACIGGIMIPYMLESKYHPGFASSVAACAGSLGPIIPPSVIFLAYGVVNGVSVTKLFMAGVIPGILLGLVMMAICYFVAKKEHYGTAVEIAEEKGIDLNVWKNFKEAIWALLVPGIILGGIYSGAFSPTEAAVVSCVYAIFIGFFVYKEFTVKSFLQAMVRAVRTCGILIMLSAAISFGRLLTLEQVPTMIANKMLTISQNPIIIMLIINLILLMAGMIMDSSPCCNILGPLLLPVAQRVGIDPVQFGAILIVNLAIGQVTPPVGINLFMALKVSNIKMEDTFKYVYLLIGGMLLVLMLVTFVPGISMFLPNLRSR